MAAKAKEKKTKPEAGAVDPATVARKRKPVRSRSPSHSKIRSKKDRKKDAKKDDKKDAKKNDRKDSKKDDKKDSKKDDKKDSKKDDKKRKERDDEKDTEPKSTKRAKQDAKQPTATSSHTKKPSSSSVPPSPPASTDDGDGGSDDDSDHDSDRSNSLSPSRHSEDMDRCAEAALEKGPAAFTPTPPEPPAVRTPDIFDDASVDHVDSQEIEAGFRVHPGLPFALRMLRVFCLCLCHSIWPSKLHLQELLKSASPAASPAESPAALPAAASPTSSASPAASRTAEPEGKGQGKTRTRARKPPVTWLHCRHP